MKTKSDTQKFLAVVLLALIPAPVHAAQTPLQAYQANIADENRDYAKVPHAMLKIQDSVYLGEGDTAVLIGTRGRPQSWRWNSKPGAQGPLHVAFLHGRLSASLNGKTVAEATLAKSVPIDADIDVDGQLTQVGAGVIGWRIFVYDQQNPAARNFTGVSYYPFDPAFRVTARFIPDPKLPARVFRTSRGTGKQFFHGGDAVFTLKGVKVTLPFYAENNQPSQIKDMSAFYTDRLTGKGAYGAGRYVDIQDFGKFPPATVGIDFNQAYNPNCARSAHFTCPVAIDDIPVAVTAGERDPHFHR